MSGEAYLNLDAQVDEAVMSMRLVPRTFTPSSLDESAGSSIRLTRSPMRSNALARLTSASNIAPGVLGRSDLGIELETDRVGGFEAASGVSRVR
ncbi:MAG: hypothetical protein ACR2RL_26750 [Gammaproteobacteria bacterium]